MGVQKFEDQKVRFLVSHAQMPCTRVALPQAIMAALREGGMLLAEFDGR